MMIKLGKPFHKPTNFPPFPSQLYIQIPNHPKARSRAAMTSYEALIDVNWIYESQWTDNHLVQESPVRIF